MANKDGYDRIEYLKEVVEDGEKAAAVLEFASRYREDINKETLEVLQKETDSNKVQDAISYYRAVVRFCEMLESTVSFGERKEKTLVKELKK